MLKLSYYIFWKIYRMPVLNDQIALVDEIDSVDSYFECITSCGLDAEGSDCLTRCIEVHLKSNLD